MRVFFEDGDVEARLPASAAPAVSEARHGQTPPSSAGWFPLLFNTNFFFRPSILV